MTFTLPDNPLFPLEVETVGGLRAFIDSDQGARSYPFIGRVIRSDGIEMQMTWSCDGERQIRYNNEHDLKPLFVPVIPDFVPDGWWVTRNASGYVRAGSVKPSENINRFIHTDKSMDGLECCNWDWDKTFHPSWDWTKCKLQKKGKSFHG